jgi:hypothetical protein
MIWILGLLAAVGGVLTGLLFFGALQRVQSVIFRERCQGTAWRRTFPNASKEAIREFLEMFVDAFAFPRSEMLKFNPDDDILGIYRNLYPSKWIPDALELETLAKDIKAKYGITLESVWDEQLTLGGLFRATQMPSTS